MRVLVTGARGKVGRAAVAALQRAGHDTVATDLAAPDFDTPPPGTAPYVKADLTDAGEVYALVGGASVGEGPRLGPFEAVVHAGALPAPGPASPAGPTSTPTTWPRRSGSPSSRCCPDTR